MAGTDLELYRQSVTDLSTLAFRDVNSVLTSMDGASGVAVRNTLIQTLPDVVNPYMVASGALSATLYEDWRHAALGGQYYATSSAAVNTAKMESLVRWGVRPMFGQSDSTVLSLIGGGVQRMIADASRETVVENAKQDVESVSWRRVARPGACDWCVMLAGRGDVYNSKASALGVVGAGVDESASFNTDGSRKPGGLAGGVKARGDRALGSKGFHDFCRCVVEPTFYYIDSAPDPRTGIDRRVLRPITQSQHLALAAFN